MTTLLSAALTEAEIEELDTFLAELDSPINSFEALDGLFCVLICAPTSMPQNQYVDVILGKSAFVDPTQAKQMMSFMTRHWNTVVKTLQQATQVGEVYVPALIVDDNGNPTGTAWAEGFLVGLALTQDDWHAFSQKPDLGDLLSPMKLLGHEHHAEPTLRSPNPSQEEREDLLDAMFDNLMLIYEYFQRKRATKQR